MATFFLVAIVKDEKGLEHTAKRVIAERDEKPGWRMAEWHGLKVSFGLLVAGGA